MRIERCEKTLVVGVVVLPSSTLHDDGAISCVAIVDEDIRDGSKNPIQEQTTSESRRRPRK